MRDSSSTNPIFNRCSRPRLVQWLAVIGWLAWVGSIGLLLKQHWSRVVHPVVIPFLLLLITTLLASIVGTVIGLWRNVRRPQHRAAFVWGLACFLPLGCWIGLSCDTLRVMANGQSLPKNVFSDISNMASATLMEGDLRLAYRQQLESQRLVMFYDDRVISPHSDLEAMDRHLADLELATGRSLRPKVHWVRGGLACGKWPFAVSAWEVRTALPIGNLPIIQIG